MPSKKTDNTKPENKVYFIIAYIIPIITGLIVLFINEGKDKRLKLHAIQAIFLGILLILISVIFGFIGFLSLGLFSVIGAILELLIWLYGIYVGFEGYAGRDVEIPTITSYAKRYSG
jgi:uncharacterized membrane protein